MDANHKTITDYLSAILPTDVWWTTFPLGVFMGHGVEGAKRMAKLKAAGLVIGTPDVLIISGGKAHWLEIKGPKGRISKDQWATHMALAVAGCPVAVVTEPEDVDAILSDWGIPVVGRVAA